MMNKKVLKEESKRVYRYQLGSGSILYTSDPIPKEELFKLRKTVKKDYALPIINSLKGF